GPCQMIDGGRDALSTMTVLGLQLCCQLHTAPLLLVQLAVSVAVEALQQAGELALPLADHIGSRRSQIEPLTPATSGTELTNRIERLALVQAFLDVAVLLAPVQPAQPAMRRQTSRMAQVAGPDAAECRQHLGALRIDQAFAGGIGQTQP